MRRAPWLLAATCALWSATTGCETIDKGQLVLVVQTDLSLPKDVDTIRIEVLNEGVPKFKNDYERLGTDTAPIVLPASLGLVAPEDPSRAITVLVSARAGGRDGKLRLVRDVVTTVPPDRAALLEIPLQFLCDGHATLEDGNAVSDCAEGQTCIAGTCKTNAVDSSTLPDYEETLVFGNGSCFDVAGCFEAPTRSDVDANCTIAAGSVNVALETEGDGICGPGGCFVVLDAESDVGWRTDGDRIVLPPAVCEQIAVQKIVAVVTTPVSDRCRPKDSSQPTCGPWSANPQNPPPAPGPVTVAGGQARPVSLAIDGGFLHWTTDGAPDVSPAVKLAPIGGGTPSTFVAMGPPPRDIVAAGGRMLWTAALPMGMGMGVVMVREPGTVDPVPLVEGLTSPEGIALDGDDLFWTVFDAAGTIVRANADGTGATDIATGNYPYRIAVDDDFVYWTNEGTLGAGDGGLSRAPRAGGASETLADSIETPRALALERDGGAATAIWFTSFAEDGALYRVQLPGGAPTAIVTGLAFPNGIAIDADHVYLTARGTGTVARVPRTAAAGASPEIVASTQKAPGSMVLDGGFLYWINEGTSNAKNGAVMKLSIAPAP